MIKVIRRDTHVEVHHYGIVIEYHDGFVTTEPVAGLITITNPQGVVEVYQEPLSSFVDATSSVIGVTLDELKAALTPINNAVMSDIGGLEWLIYNVLHNDPIVNSIHERDGRIILDRNGDTIIWALT